MAELVAGKVALVTGAGSGIGRASALAFAREGARVVVSDVDEAGGQETAELVRKAGGDASFVSADVAQESEVAALVAEAIARYGRLDCAHNNAGVAGSPAALHETSAEEAARVLGVNLLGVLYCLKHEIAHMLGKGGGAIVNTSSGAGLIGTPGLAPYCASKHAVLGLTKTAALENARTNIRVNAICPGAIDTPMLEASMAGSDAIRKMVLASQPGGRLGRPEEIAELAVFLCSDRASFITGATINVDGGAVSR